MASGLLPMLRNRARWIMFALHAFPGYLLRQERAARVRAVLDTRFRLSAAQVRRGKMRCIRRTHGRRCGVDQSGRAGQSGRHVRAKHKPWLNDLGERAPTSMRMLGLILGRHDL